MISLIRVPRLRTSPTTRTIGNGVMNCASGACTSIERAAMLAAPSRSVTRSFTG